MKPLIILIFILSQVFASGQNIIPGKYNSRLTYTDSLDTSTTLSLNCDKTFISKDGDIIALGKWHQKNDKVIILVIDSSTINFKSNYSKRKIVLTKKDNKLFYKEITKREYSKLNKEITEAAGERPMFDNHSEIKKRENRSYYIKESAFQCE